MRIVFVRHGEPDYAHDCLTEQGKIQAMAAAERLKEEGIEEIYASPLGRAAETAAYFSEAVGLPVHTLPFMRELNWGSLDETPIPCGGHPWDLADKLAAQGWDLTNPAWREHAYFKTNLATVEADHVAQEGDKWLRSLGYERNGAYYRCVRPDDRQATVALFSHGGSSAALMGHILNLTFPYACAVFHLEFTGITIIRFDRKPSRQAMPCLELANDGRHIRDARYHRLANM